MPKIKIPTLMVYYVNGEYEINLPGTILKEILSNLITRYPDIEYQLFDGKNTLRRHINIFINDKNIKDLEQLNSSINENDIIRIVPSISGG
ncbi:MAG: MoaD/ThiS family protein [Chloroflexota bacterium]